jgi:ferric-dicitrate binding protein FerR (iron transport regulator)
MEVKHQEDILALIAKILAGLANSVETAQLKEWIESSKDNKQYFEQVKNIWDASDKHIDSKKIDTARALGMVHSRILKVSSKRTFWYYWQKVAAIILLPLAFGALLLIYLNSNKTISSNEIVYSEVFAAFGTRSLVTLADSTMVWLNSGSSLRYPNKFNNKKRKVFLKGEAYFEVNSDVSRPFIVETLTLQIKATGTKFNVQEYDLYPVTEVALISGKVFVNESGNNQNPQLISELYPNQHLSYNRQTKVKSITNEDVYRFIAWKDGKFIFRDEPLDKVLDKISAIFNVDIELQGKELKDYRYHATFQDESLEEILKLLKLSAPICFTELKRNPLPDGSFPKKKVIVFPEKQKNIVTLSD